MGEPLLCIVVILLSITLHVFITILLYFSLASITEKEEVVYKGASKVLGETLRKSLLHLIHGPKLTLVQVPAGAAISRQIAHTAEWNYGQDSDWLGTFACVCVCVCV